ncbi:MAG: hypothetical protein MR215_06085 [Bacteroidales bacterium]|nr:hypothetical protein [Bacteroidales bacterium]MDY4174403.1 hypothetical protein [Bacteroidales bacterium]
MNRLIGRVVELKAENSKLQAEVSRLTAELEACRSEVQESHRELECCRLGMALRGSVGVNGVPTADEAKRQIDLLVRGIDECIALLKQ